MSLFIDEAEALRLLRNHWELRLLANTARKWSKPVRLAPPSHTEWVESKIWAAYMRCRELADVDSLNARLHELIERSISRRTDGPPPGEPSETREHGRDT